MQRGLLSLFLALPVAASAAITAGSLESHSTVSSSTVTSSKEHARIGNAHVVVINRIKHPLIIKTMKHARAQLEASGLAGKWEFIEGAQPKFHAVRTPDLFIVIDSATITEKGLVSRSIDATVNARLATDPYLSTHSRSTGEEPPLVRLKFEMTVDHNSTRKGIETEKYAMLSKEIANELVKGLTNALKNAINEYDVLPALPDYLYGENRPAPTFDFLGTVEPEFSGAGLLSHNESFWTFDVPSNFVPRLQAIREILASSGWRDDVSQLTNTAPPDLYFTKDNALIEIFPPESTSTSLRPTGATRRLVFRYCEWLSRAEREEALGKLLKEETSAETLLMFQHNFSSQQRKQLYSRLKDSAFGSPAGYLAAADYYLHEKNTNAAKAMLMRANAAQRTFARKKDMDRKIEKAWKDIAGKEKLQVSANALKEIGFIEFTNDCVAVEKRAGEPLLVFAANTEGKAPHTIALQIQSSPGTNRFHTLDVFQTYGGGYSHTTQPYEFSRSREWQQRSNHGGTPVRLSAKAIPGTNAFRLEVTKEKTQP